MKLQVDWALTLAVACAVLLVGAALKRRISFLRTYSIPDPVTGGLVAAVLMTLMRGMGVEIRLDPSLQQPLMLMFFATVGLGADLALLVRGGRLLLMLMVSVVGLLVLQNAVGVGLALALGQHPSIGLLAGSISMSGGHGTGAAYGARFAQQFGLNGTTELALAAATFGLILGGLIGGPLAERLIRRHRLEGPKAAHVAAAATAATVYPSPAAMIPPLMLGALCIAAGIELDRAFQDLPLTLPSFVWALFSGVVLRNGLAATGIYQLHEPALERIGGLALSLFLALALASLRLWEVAGLALPLLVIVLAQLVVTGAYASYASFRLLGSNYDAAVMVVAQCGFGLGATPTAIANMQAVTAQHGPSPAAFLLVPVVGAFLIDLANALVINGFLVLPVFRG
jgi:glutamate:Na+ symporter, ESS family